MKVGKLLAWVREKSGMSQKLLAKKLKISETRVSRIENDETTLNNNEINAYLKPIGTSEAIDLNSYLKQDWQRLNKPNFFNPSRKSLWLAESALIKNDELKNGIDKNSVFYKELELHHNTLEHLADYLQSTEHTIAFIGSIGVGKTTAICGFSGLKHNGEPVLHTGSGRSTVCEVQIKQGPAYGITIDPLTEDEVYKYVSDFCDYLMAKISEQSDDKKYIDIESYALNREIERCIRNMSRLPIKRLKIENKFQQQDHAIKLIDKLRGDNNISNEDLNDDLKIKVIMRMNLDGRKKTELWYQKNIEDHPLEWLKVNYKQINHGLHPQFSIPRRITINIPVPVLSYDRLNIKIIDTKGVDETAKREDLEIHINDPRTLTVFNSGFLDAPDETTRTLIDRAIESGIKGRLSNETAILVLPRDEEAIRVNTLDGSPIEDREEGYTIRSDDIQSDLMKYDLKDLPISFYDERKDSSEDVKNFLLDRLGFLRNLYEKRIEEVSNTINRVEENIQDAKAEAAYNTALKSINAWIKNNKEIKPIGKVHKSLIETIEDKKTYAASVRASVNRSGIWHNLDYYYQIGFGTRTEAVKSIADMLSELHAIIKNLQFQEGMEPAREFLKELSYFCTSETERVFKEIQKFSQEIYKKKMIDIGDFWYDLQKEWGQGPGYKIRISKGTNNWFKDGEPERLNKVIENKIADAWGAMLSKFEELAKGIFS